MGEANAVRCGGGNEMRNMRRGTLRGMAVCSQASRWLSSRISGVFGALATRWGARGQSS